MTKRRTRLRMKQIESIGLVDKGANKGSHVLISKRADDDPAGDDPIGEMFAELAKRANVGELMESMIHRDFTVSADSRFGDGLLTRDERIALSNSIGSALDAFRETLEGLAPELYERSPWSEPDVEKSDGGVTKARSSDTIDGGDQPPQEEPQMEAPAKLSAEVLEKLDPAVREHIETLEKTIADTPDPDPDPQPDVTKRDDLPEEVRKAIDAAEEKAAKAIEKADRLEEEARVAKAEATAKSLANVGGEDLPEILMAVDERLEPEVAAKVHTLLKSVDERLDTAGIFEEFGAGGVRSEPETQLEERARKRAADEGISYERAYKREWDALPGAVRKRIEEGSSA